MVFLLCSVESEEKIASISFSGNYLGKFGFNAGANVIVDISKGLIVIKLNDNNKADHVGVTRIEKGAKE